MFEFVLHHWRGLSLGTGSLGLVALLVLVVLNPTAAVGLVRAVGGTLLGWARGFVDWVRSLDEAGRWRAACFTLAAVCAFFAIQTGSARHERDAALRDLASVKTTIKTERENGRANVRAAQLQCRADSALALAKAQAHARDVERQLASALADLAARNQRERADAKHNGDAVAAGIRAGAVQLRDEWAGARAAPFDVPGPAGAPGGQDSAADLRATGAGRLVEIGDSCDADIRYYQSVLAAEREVK